MALTTHAEILCGGKVAGSARPMLEPRVARAPLGILVISNTTANFYIEAHEKSW